MQTNFTAEQLRDPDTASSNQVLRTCVHCGICTATCPTFLLLGDELDSPRGRIYLIKDMLETGRPATEEVVRHIDRCLSCLSCMTTCPSGVNYMHLVDHARTYIERTYRRPWDERLLRALLGKVLPRSGCFRLALLGAQAGAAVGAIAARFRALGPTAARDAGPGARRCAHRPVRLRQTACASGAGQTPRTRGAAGGLRAAGAGAAINEATIRLLTRLGVEVVVPPGAGCCGALTHHMGQHATALASARANIDAWTREIEDEGLDAIVVNASGCGTTVKDYGFHVPHRAGTLAQSGREDRSLACDISELLARLGYAPVRDAPGLTVAYHSACSLQHGQQVTAQPKPLLQRAGFTVVEPAEAHICCGSAGTYNMLQPDIAARLRERKLANLRATKPDLIAAGNIGCITQLSGDTVPVVHTVELLDWMAGGPRPAALGVTE